MENKAIKNNAKCCIKFNFKGMRGNFGWETYWFFRSSAVKLKGINGKGLLWLQSGLCLEGKYQRSKTNCSVFKERLMQANPKCLSFKQNRDKFS